MVSQKIWEEYMRPRFEFANEDNDGPEDFDAHSDDPSPSTAPSASPSDPPSPDFGIPPSLSEEAGRTDAANAQRLVSQHGENIRYVSKWGKWLVWDGCRWKTDPTLWIEQLAKQTAADLWREIARLQGENVDRKIIDGMISWAKYSNSKRAIAALIDLAKSDPLIAITPDQLDSDHWLLNVENGTIDLCSGAIREHRREDFITKLTPVLFDPAATAPLWDSFLLTVLESNDLVGFVQRLAGLSITGDTSEDILVVLHGIGGNGKTTFLETLLNAIGQDYAVVAASDLLMANPADTHPTGKADLFGKRFVACFETDDGGRLAEARVKALTGGDKVRVRRMREDYWEFDPTHKLWLLTNYKPEVRGTDHGIWRRIKLIPFNVIFSDDSALRPDKQLPDKLSEEKTGILNWLIAGCREWQRNGLGEPLAVKTATKGYAQEMDELGQFIAECCEVGEGDGYIVPATPLFHAFREHTGSSLSQKAFGRRLRERGYASGRITSGPDKGRSGWTGIRLRPNEG